MSRKVLSEKKYEAVVHAAAAKAGRKVQKRPRTMLEDKYANDPAFLQLEEIHKRVKHHVERYLDIISRPELTPRKKIATVIRDLQGRVVGMEQEAGMSLQEIQDREFVKNFEENLRRLWDEKRAVLRGEHDRARERQDAIKIEIDALAEEGR